MVGGRLIQIAMLSPAAANFWRLWCVNGTDELAVNVRLRDGDPLPELGDEIWWQSGRVYFDSDNRSLEKVGNSYDPRKVASKHI